MTYLNSKNTLWLLVLIGILISIIIIITRDKKEIFTDSFTDNQNENQNKNDSNNEDTSTKTSLKMCQNIDNNITKLENDLSIGKKYLQTIEKSVQNDNNLEKCIVHSELTLIDLLLMNEMMTSDKDANYIKQHIDNKSLVDNFLKIHTLELQNTLRNTLKNVSERLLKDSSVEEDKAELLKKVINNNDKLDENLIKSVIQYLKKYSETRASVFTIDERTPIKHNCHEVPPFLKNMDQCNQYGYLSNLEQTIIKNECNKCNSCNDDNSELSYSEQLKKMDTGICNNICNKRSELGIPEYCDSTSSKVNMNNNVEVDMESEENNIKKDITTSNTSSNTVSDVPETNNLNNTISNLTTTTTTTPTTTTKNINRKPMAAYGENTDLANYFNIEDIGKSISDNVGEVMTKLGYAGYNPGIEETPIPRVYDNTLDYRVLNQGLSNLEQDNLNRANKNSGGSGGGTNYSAPVVVQEDIQGVSNVFAPYIIFHNTDHEPNANMGQNGMIQTSTEKIKDSDQLNIDGLPIEKYLKSVM